jgi:hypothetical protein
MAKAKSNKIKEGIAEKMLRCHRARERGKRAYAKADDLLEQLLQEIKPGKVVKLESGSAQIVDKLAGGKIKSVDVGYWRRYELKVLP